MKTCLIFFTWLTSAALAATTILPISGGRLDTDLNGNGHALKGAASVSLGNTNAHTATIHLFPGATPTSAAQGIWFGDDVKIYRSGAAETTIVGNLVISGTISAGGSSVSLTGNNTWSGTNAWSAGSTFTGSAYINNGSAGLTFSSAAAIATRTNLALVPGTHVMAYSAPLQSIGALTPALNAILVGNGAAWTAATGSTVRTAAGLGTGDSVSFGGISTTGNATLGSDTADTLTVNAVASFPNATSSGTGVSIGGIALYVTGGKLTTTGPATVTGLLTGTAGLTLTNATSTGVCLTLGDVKLYAPSSGAMRIDGALTVSSLVASSPVPAASGGTGFASYGSGNILYANSTTTLAQTAMSAFMRGLLASTDDAAARGTLGIGTAGGSLTGTYPNPTVAAGAVTSSMISDGTIVAADLADGAVATAQIAAGAVTSAKLAALSGLSGGTYGSTSAIPVLTINAQGQITGVTTATPSASPVGAVNGDLTGSLPSPTIADGAVTSVKILDGTIQDADLAAATITNASIANNTIGTNQLAVSGVAAGSYPAVGLSAYNMVPRLTVDASGRITAAATVNISGLVLGTQTTGGYVESITAGSGISVTGGTGAGSTPTIALSPAPSAIGTTLMGAASAAAAYGAVTLTTTAGDIIVRGASTDARFPVGADGQYLMADTAAGQKVKWGGYSRQAFSNAAVTVAAGTTMLAQTGTMSASRAVTLPAANAYKAGTGFVIADESGTVSAVYPLVLTRAGGDTLNGVSTQFLAAPHGAVYLVSDGSSKWTINSQAVRSTTTPALVSGVITVSDVTISANTRILVNRHADAGTIGASYSVSRSAGTGYTITSKDSSGSTEAGDTSTLDVLLIEP